MGEKTKKMGLERDKEVKEEVHMDIYRQGEGAAMLLRREEICEEEEERKKKNDKRGKRTKK